MCKGSGLYATPCGANRSEVARSGRHEGNVLLLRDRRFGSGNPVRYDDDGSGGLWVRGNHLVRDGVMRGEVECCRVRGGEIGESSVETILTEEEENKHTRESELAGRGREVTEML